MQLQCESRCKQSVASREYLRVRYGGRPESSRLPPASDSHIAIEILLNFITRSNISTPSSTTTHAHLPLCLLKHPPRSPSFWSSPKNSDHLHTLKDSFDPVPVAVELTTKHPPPVSTKHKRHDNTPTCSPTKAHSCTGSSPTDSYIYG